MITAAGRLVVCAMLALGGLLTALPGCASETAVRPGDAGAVIDANSPAGVLTREYTADLIRHLYRWHFDETMLRAVSTHADTRLLVRELRPALDPGDESRFLEVIAQRMGLRITLKKAAYTVEETGARVENDSFKLFRVEMLDDERPTLRGRGFAEVRFERADLLDHLFKTRNDVVFPDPELRRRLGEALRDHLKGDAPAFDTEPQTFHIAPLSPVSNELWVYWENGHRLIRFSADADLADKAYWDAAGVAIEVFDLRKDVLVSFEEAPGSNAFVTRDWASRALFNCVGLGQRLVTTPKP